MGERSVRTWFGLTSVLLGASVALAPMASAAPAGTTLDGDPAATVVLDPVPATPVVPASAEPVPAPAEPAPGEPAVAEPVPAPAEPQPEPAEPQPEPAEPPAAPAPTDPAPTGPDAASEPTVIEPAPGPPAVAAAPAPATTGPAAAVAAEALSATLAAEAARVAPACVAMTADIHRANNPRTRASLLSSFKGEVTKAKRYGFTDQRGVAFRAATSPAPGLEPVYRLQHPETRDFLYILTERGRDRAVELYGYRYSQVAFYVSAERVPCAVPVHRYLRGTMHRFAASRAERDALEAAGWRSEGVKFWAAPPGARPEVPVDPEPTDPEPTRPDGDTTFTIAVLPDTQYEVFGGDRFANRNRWLVRNRDALDLRFVLHTGDIVSWDTPDHGQYERASDAMRVLDDAGLPTTVAIGNHDTAAVAVGGSAVPGGNTRALVRDTRTFNRYFPPGRYDPEGVFEPGKVDNTFQLFSAGGRDWMILTLELWPRKEVVRWAQDVVASHPDRLVIVQTHSYLRSNGSIMQRRDYGATSPQYLYDNLVSRYPNIRMVFSGHVGTAGHRLDRGVHGNRIASFLGTFHSKSSNPVQLVEIDTARGTVSTDFVSPVDGRTWPMYDVDVAGMDFD